MVLLGNEPYHNFLSLYQGRRDYYELSIDKNYIRIFEKYLIHMSHQLELIS